MRIESVPDLGSKLLGHKKILFVGRPPGPGEKGTAIARVLFVWGRVIAFLV